MQLLTIVSHIDRYLVEETRTSVSSDRWRDLNSFMVAAISDVGSLA